MYTSPCENKRKKFMSPRVVVLSIDLSTVCLGMCMQGNYSPMIMCHKSVQKAHCVQIHIKGENRSREEKVQFSPPLLLPPRIPTNPGSSHNKLQVQRFKG